MYQLVNGGGWFLSAILRFYVVLYILRFLFKDKIKWSFYMLFVVAVALWFYLSAQKYVNIYEAASKYAWFIYLIIMLEGFCLGAHKAEGKQRSLGFWSVCTIALVVIYYGLMAMARRFEMPIFELVSLIPMFALLYAVLKLFDNQVFNDVWSKKWCWPFRFLSTHCWEIYLAQLFFVFTYNNNFDRVFPFPLNIPMTFLAIFATGYVIKVISQLIIQLFSKGDFDWIKIIKTWN